MIVNESKCYILPVKQQQEENKHQFKIQARKNGRIDQGVIMSSKL